MAPDAGFSDLDRKHFERAVAHWRQRVEALKEQPSTAPDLNVTELLAAVETLNTAEEELRQQNEALLEAREAVDAERDRYQSLFEFAPDAYVVTDVHGVILEANHVATRLFGVAHRHLIDKPLATFVDDAGRRNFRKQLDLLCGIGLTDPWACDLRTRGGAMVSVEMTVSSVRDRHGRTTELRWLIRDITKRKRAEEHIRRLNATLEERVAERTRQLELRSTQLEDVIAVRDELLRRISRDVRTALQSLVAHTALVRLRLAEDVEPELRAYLERVEVNTAHIVGVVNTLLDQGRQA